MLERCEGREFQRVLLKHTDFFKDYKSTDPITCQSANQISYPVFPKMTIGLEGGQRAKLPKFDDSVIIKCHLNLPFGF